MADHAEDLLMFDFPNTVKGIEAYGRTWDFFDASRRGAVTFRPGEIRVTAGTEAAFASCEIHCDGTTAGPLDFRLTTCFERMGGRWIIVHEHHSMPTTDEVLVGPDVTR
ncbi:nuclear transport factor 2 family protein [Brucella sp. JSBI001]|uniref:nuclear transport factor 2 family protein n=1 Tax=Brucella sp. JSBI001 TaxID=2886044 RepID=UPI002231E7FF|nr:nuclear transport factor 2 family protein [Brucella sp. JSBI001]UZD69380.1 nuclear transport factor 2 family protein [Brucella sp. JSBI001]